MPKGEHKTKITDHQLIQSVREVGLAGTAKRYRMNERTVFRRRNDIQNRLQETIASPLGPGGKVKQTQQQPHRIPLTIPNGVVIVAGDAHYWPGAPPFMHTALLSITEHFRQKKQLRAFIANGDMVDFAAISRFPLINWEKQPLPAEEIETCQDRMHEISEVAGRVPKLWPGGNHDIRFSRLLAEKAPQMAGVKGTHLKDHFALWQACWSVLINENTFVKHRIRGGIYAVRNNVLASGLHTVTNHLHAACIIPITTIRSTLYGVDTGCIADISGPQFLYTEDNPKNWREAFAVLTYDDGELLPPELVLRHEIKRDCIIFRGEVIRV